MDRTPGIALVDLFEIVDTVNSVLPANVRDFIERFVVVGAQTVVSTLWMIPNAETATMFGVTP